MSLHRLFPILTILKLIIFGILAFYPIHNCTFVVYSILDHKDNWPSGKDVEGENKICLFHGPVNKAETDIGYTVSSNSFTADMFDGFDMALLGDIHRDKIWVKDITCCLRWVNDTTKPR
jgi:hypothetical protein